MEKLVLENEQETQAKVDTLIDTIANKTDVINDMRKLAKLGHILSVETSKVLLEPEEVNQVSTGGVIMPDFDQEVIRKGKVLNTGPGYLIASGVYVPLAIQIGDTAIYSKNAANEFEYDGKKYHVIDAQSIYSFVSEN